MSKIKVGSGDESGLDAPSLALLAEDFAPLDSLARNLASRVVCYLLDGTGGKVLAELAALSQAGQKLRLCGAAALPSEADGGHRPPLQEAADCGSSDGGPGGHRPPLQGALPPGARSRFFQSAPGASPQFFVRLGKVYEAASRPLRFRMARLFGDPALDWLQVLLIEATQLTLDTWPRRCQPCALLTADLIEAMLEAEGHPRDVLARAAFLPPRAARSRFGLEMEPVWAGIPGLGASAGRHPAAVLAALGQSNYKPQLRALNLMTQCHAPPVAFIGKLFELARSRSRRIRAQAGLLLGEVLPQARPFLREKAARGGSGERAFAARMLWRAEGENARAFLTARLPFERSRTVARVIRDLLASASPEPCGTPDAASGRAAARPYQDVAPPPPCADETVVRNRATLLEKSARGLAAGMPEALSWFPFQQLPPVHWANDGRPVEPEIVRGWVTQCWQLKSPEPGPLLRQFAAALESSGREALGQFVLEAWIRRDATPSARAIAGKGILALAGACAGAAAAPLVHRYLEQWYGLRAGQCCALLQMLAWVRHPSAAQLLRAVAIGFRTQSIQEEAGRQAEYLAERQ